MFKEALLIAAASIGVVGTACAGIGSRDVYTDGAKAARFDVYSGGARTTDARDTFTDGSRAIDKRDVFTDGARITDKRDAFTDGA